MVSRGERELRGERRGKGGRSLLATAAPFFFIYLMFPASLAGQRVDVYGRAGVAGSTALVRDEVATAPMAELLGARVDEEVRAVPKPALTVAGGIRARFWPRVALTADVEWTPTELEARDDGGSRPIQDLDVVQAAISAQWAVRPAVELGAGAGLVWYSTAETGLFAGGSDASPLLEVSAGWTPALWGGRVAVLGSARTHRFGTQAVRAAGGQDGSVTRFSLTARVRLLEVGQ